jgi:hypothetical protein
MRSGGVNTNLGSYTMDRNGIEIFRSFLLLPTLSTQDKARVLNCLLRRFEKGAEDYQQ